MEDIRWKQRFDNFVLATKELEDAVILKNSRELSVLEKKGLIQSFEIVHELAWNLLKDYLQAVGGTTGLLGSRDTTREAFKRGLISDGDTWMEMIISRNQTARIYDEATCQQFYPCFAALLQSFFPLYEQAE